jgi:hypothetical protein
MGWTPPHLNGIDVPDWKCQPPVSREKESTMKLIRVRVDLAKSVFQVHGVDRNEKAVWCRKLTRESYHFAVRQSHPELAAGLQALLGTHSHNSLLLPPAFGPLRP